MRPAQLFTVLDREFQATLEGHHTPVMLWGPPGVGKSQIVSQVAAAELGVAVSTDIYTLRGAEVMPSCAEIMKARGQ